MLCIKHKSKSLISAPHSLKFTRCRRLAMYHLREYGPHKAAEARRGYGDLSRDALQDILFAFTLEDYDGRLDTSRTDLIGLVGDLPKGEGGVIVDPKDVLLHTEVAWLETEALRALVSTFEARARSGTGLTAATPRAELERRWGVLVAASPPEGDQPVGLRAFLNADHYLTTDTIAQYDRYLRDLQGLGNVAPSVVVVSLDGFVDWVTRTLQERAVPHERTLFCVSDVIAGYRGHHWFAVWVDFTRGSTGRVRSRTDRGAEPTEQPDREADSRHSRRTRRKPSD